MNNLAVIILAAGKGTRMNSDLPKVLHELDGKPLVQHVIDTVQMLNPTDIVLVVGHRAELVREKIGDGVRYALQSGQLGTGHAVAQAADALKDHHGDVLILYGDMPLLTAETVEKLVTAHAENAHPLTMLTVTADNPRGFGRIVRDSAGNVIAIVEEVDCTPEQLAINELNTGVYCIRADWLWKTLPKITLSAKGEYYLTDLVALAVADGHTVHALTTDNLVETMGINTPQHLAEAEAQLRKRLAEERRRANYDMCYIEQP